MVLRAALLWLSEQRGIFSFIRGNRLARRFAARFVAGETVEAAVAALAEMPAARSEGTRLNSSHRCISYAVFCLKKKNNKTCRKPNKPRPRLDVHGRQCIYSA